MTTIEDEAPDIRLPLRAHITRQLIEIASWRLVAELVRRHPDFFHLIEMHPSGGLADCLSLIAKDKSRHVYFNREGRMWVKAPRRGVLQDETPAHIWPRMLVADDPSTVVDWVDALLGLDTPKSLPQSPPAVIVVRFIAAFLTHAAFGRRSWQCRNGFHDSAGSWGGVMTEWFDAFPAAAQLREHDGPHAPLGNSAYSFWFICEGAHTAVVPEMCLHTSGRAWRRDGSEFDLPVLYSENRRIWPVIMKAAGDLLP